MQELLKNFELHRDYMEDRIKSGIEANRKGFAELQIMRDGKPVPGAKVHLTLKNHAFRFGCNLFMLDELETPEKNETYKARFRELFNMATLPFYWDSTEPEKGHLRYDIGSTPLYRRPPIDLCMQFCQENNIEPREHALAYDAFFPAWLKGQPMEVVKREYERRCAEIAERYADKIRTIEVVNETMRKEFDYYMDPDWVKWCFDTARKYFPANQLGINDLTSRGFKEGRRGVYSPYYLLVENLLLKGTPIDAVGFQYHVFFQPQDMLKKTEHLYNPLSLYRVLDAYSNLHLPMQITEVTVPAFSNGAEDEMVQAELIRNLYSIWFSYPNVEQIVYWNLPDGYAAFAEPGDMSGGENFYHGGLLRFNLTAKPAYEVLKRLIKKEWHTDVTVETDRDGRTGFRGFYGDYDAQITVDGKVVTAPVSFPKNTVHDPITVTL